MVGCLLTLTTYGNRSISDNSGKKSGQQYQRRLRQTFLVPEFVWNFISRPAKINLQLPSGENGDVMQHTRALDYEQLPFQCNRCREVILA